MKRSLKHSLGLLCTLLAASFLGLPARADAANAGALEEQGQAALKAGDYDQAVARLTDALAAAPDDAAYRNALADAQDAWAASLQKAGQYDDALTHYRAAFELDTGHRPANAVDELDSEGACDESLSQYSEAAACYEKALILNRAAKDGDGEGHDLGSLGECYARLNRYDKAVDYAQQALPLMRAAGDKDGQRYALTVLGEAYVGAGRHAEAITAYQQALTLQKAANDQAGEGQTLYHIGAAYFNQGDYEKSAQYTAQALPFLRAATDLSDEGEALNNLGAACQVLGEDDKAVKYYQQGLGLARMTSDLPGESLVLSNLMVMAQQVQEPRLAIFYGKQAINIYESVRADIGNMDPETQKSYLHSVAQNYRVLADQLIASGRLLEAQQVLDLLKGEEYLNFTHRAAGAAPVGHVDLTQAESNWNGRYRKVADQVTALATERQALQDSTSRTQEQSNRLAALGPELDKADQGFQAFLNQLDVEASRAAGDDPVQVKQAEDLRAKLRALGPGVAVVYTLVTDNRYRAVLYTPDAQTAMTSAVTAADLLHKVVQFRALLQNSKSDPKPLAQQLYKLLIGPLVPALQAAHVKTLMWELDGSLRYIPVATLYDGQRYLVEDYRNVIFTPDDTTHLSDVPDATWSGIGMGVSKSQPGFSALPSVPNELHSIIRGASGQAGVLPGQVVLDEGFTPGTIQDLEQQHYQVVHIASHFAFHPGSASDSYLVMGDGSHLTLDRLRSEPNLFHGVNLLTLSACNTAVGDIEEQDGGANGKEVECFAVLAQRQGAEAVLASLWPVSDNSTRELMDQFYRLREDKSLTKAEALQRAQLALLHGDIKPTDPAILLLYPHASYIHPYFWAPFVLIGNWK